MERRGAAYYFKIAAGIVAGVGTIAALSTKINDAQERRLRESIQQEELSSRALRLQLQREIEIEIRKQLRDLKSPGDPAIEARLDSIESEFKHLRDAQVASLTLEEYLSAGGEVESLERALEAAAADQEKFQAFVRARLDAQGKTLNFLLLAVLPLVIYFLCSLWRTRAAERGRQPNPAG